MMDITNPTLLKTKGALFLALGLFSSGILLCYAPDWKVALLLGLSIWAFCRFYYFAFYVLQHYADQSFRYSGLLDLIRYLLQKKK